ncbi:MAG: hypothetical protein IKX57_05420 [Oscillospiraceae bacterium]|nr:hypothetical protein [Oscillospiraceae bacterium]
MSVTLDIEDPVTGACDSMHVSFQSTWRNVWEPAIKALELHWLTQFAIPTDALPELTEEFRQVQDYVRTHDVSEKDKNDVMEHIGDILENIGEFRNQFPEAELLYLG